MRRSWWPLVAWLGVAAGGCGGPVARPGDAGPAPCNGGDVIFVNCSGCHDGASPSSGFLDLRRPQEIAALIGQRATGPRCGPGGSVMLNADGSGLLVDKLAAAPPCGDRMPQGARPLSDDETTCVRQWVAARAAGAP